MINWMRRSLRNFILKDILVTTGDDYDDNETEDNGISMPDPLEFKVQPAQGGTIVEVTSWDKKNEESIIKLHIISDGDNIADQVGKIVVMELLRR
jgi:hypothetical protein